MKYYVALGGQQFGPYTFEQLKNQPLAAGALVWREGLTAWVPLQEIPEFQANPNVPPQLPYPPPPGPTFAGNRGHYPQTARRSWSELREIAASQRRLNIGMGICVAAYVLGLPMIAAFALVAANVTGLPPEAAHLLDSLAEWSVILTMCAAQVWLAITVAKALRLANPWAWGLGSCVCCVGLISLFVLNQRATAALQQAGISVGFFGTVLPERPPT